MAIGDPTVAANKATVLALAGIVDSITPAGALVNVALNYVYDAVGGNWDRQLAGAGGAMLVDGPLVDDAGFTAGTSRVFPVGFVADDAASDSVNEDDIGAARMTLTRVLMTTAADPTTPTQRQTVGAATGASSETATQWAKVLSALSALDTAAGAGSQQVPLKVESTAAPNLRVGIYSGATEAVARALSQDQAAPAAALSAEALLVAQFDDVAPTSTTENNYGTVRMSADRVLYAHGAVAHDAVDSGNPLKIGSKAIQADGAPAAVAANDRVQAWLSLTGLLGTFAGLGCSVDVNDAIAVDVDAAVAATTGLRLMGFACRESAAIAAVATFRIMHGATAAGGTTLVPVELGPDESRDGWYGPDGLAAAGGLSIDVIAGTCDVELFTKVVV